MLPALRVSKGQLMITTTPRNTKLLRDIIKEAEKNPEEVHFTRATSSENWKAAGVTKMIQKVTSKFGEGTFLERQERQDSSPHSPVHQGRYRLGAEIGLSP